MAYTALIRNAKLHSINIASLDPPTDKESPVKIIVFTLTSRLIDWLGKLSSCQHSNWLYKMSVDLWISDIYGYGIGCLWLLTLRIIQGAVFGWGHWRSKPHDALERWRNVPSNYWLIALAFRDTYWYRALALWANQLKWGYDPGTMLYTSICSIKQKTRSGISHWDYVNHTSRVCISSSAWFFTFDLHQVNVRYKVPLHVS